MKTTGEIDAYKDQDIPFAADQGSNDGTRFGSDFLRDVNELQVGAGDSVFRADKSGIWLGAATFAAAPFKVDMDGNMTAASVVLTGYVATGGAAADINANVTTINGGKITTNSIAASAIVANSLVVGTNVLIGSALGAGQAASDINSNTTLISGGKIQTGSITAAQIQANAITADKLTAGTFNVGGTSQPTAIVIAASSISGNSRLGFQNSSRIWEDSSANMGLNAIGGSIVFYGNSTQMVQFTQGSQAIFSDGISCRGAFNVGVPNGTTQLARFTDFVYFDPTTSTNQYIIGGSSTMNYNAATQHILKIGGSEQLKVTSVGCTTQGYFYSPNVNHIDIGAFTLTLGTNKSAIVPTSKGFNALYCTESPEVWFMDFCKGKTLKSVDPMFREVTTSPYHFIKTVGGQYQVWGKRKGHEQLRFESKTLAQFKANERFLQMAK